MRRTLQNATVAVLIALALLLPQASGAHATSWHAPLRWRWTIEPICRNGVKIILRLEPSDKPGTGGTITVDYRAYKTKGRAPASPAKLTGSPTLGQQYGTVKVTAKQRAPLVEQMIIQASKESPMSMGQEC